MITAETGADLKITPSNDPRSYRMCSDKLANAGFLPKFTVLDAISDLKRAFKNNLISDHENCHNLIWMKKNINKIIYIVISVVTKIKNFFSLNIFK